MNQDLFKFDKSCVSLNDLIEFNEMYKKIREIFGINEGGMGVSDLFTFWKTLKILQPSLIIESGVWQGGSTFLIRNTLPKSKIICIDIIMSSTYRNLSSNLTTYFDGHNFIDFKDIDLPPFDPNKTLAFFDDHQNAAQRLLQSHEKGIKWCFFNDNYPVGVGSHLSISQALKDDKNSFHSRLNSIIKNIITFPNIIGNYTRTQEGQCNIECLFETKQHFLNHYAEIVKCEEGIKAIYDESLNVFDGQFDRYRWNTLIELADDK